MNGNDDLERKDDHLGKHAALALVETEVLVQVDDDDKTVYVDLHSKGSSSDSYKYLTAYQARLLADALLEAADKAEGTGLKGTK